MSENITFSSKGVILPANENIREYMYYSVYSENANKYKGVDEEKVKMYEGKKKESSKKMAETRMKRSAMKSRKN